MSTNKKERHESSKKPVSRGRHEYQCRICAHAERAEIEQAFVGWVSPVRIAQRYGVSRDAVYRHARLFGLMGKRQRNVRAALERIIEKAGEVEVTAAAVVAAVQAYSKINAIGQWIERTEHVDLHELFDRMTQQELEAYARDGSLPTWFTATIGATATDSQEA